MKVLLRLRGLDRQQHQNLLLATDECGLLWPDVEYKGSTHDKEGHNIDLKLETERDLFARGSDRIPVHRDVVDRLWDLLGILPPSRQLQVRSEMEEITRQMEGEVRYLSHMSENFQLATPESNAAASKRVASELDVLISRIKKLGI